MNNELVLWLTNNPIVIIVAITILLWMIIKTYRKVIGLIGTILTLAKIIHMAL